MMIFPPSAAQWSGNGNPAREARAVANADAGPISREAANIANAWYAT